MAFLRSLKTYHFSHGVSHAKFKTLVSSFALLMSNSHACEMSDAAMILNIRRNVDSEKKSESQMGFEPTTLVI